MSIDLDGPAPAGPVLAPPAARPQPGGRRIPWGAVLLLAAVLSVADCFVLVSLQGAVGSTERAQGPFWLWMQDSAMLAPVFALAVLGGLALARRRYGAALPGAKPVLVAVAAIVVAATLVALAALIANAAYDYHLQIAELRLTAKLHDHLPAGVTATAAPGSCTGLCADERLTLAVHAKAVGYAAVAVLGVNTLLTGWVVAALGGRLSRRSRGATRFARS